MNKTQHLKDPGSAITHFIGMLMAICGAIPLLIKATGQGISHFPCRICDQSDPAVCCQHDLPYI